MKYSYAYNIILSVSKKIYKKHFIPRFRRNDLKKKREAKDKESSWKGVTVILSPRHTIISNYHTNN